jgi:hypothetical protein
METSSADRSQNQPQWAAQRASPHLTSAPPRGAPGRPAAHPLWPSSPLSTLNSPVPRLGAWAWARPRDSTKRNPTRRSLPTEPTRPPRASPPSVGQPQPTHRVLACMHACKYATHARTLAGEISPLLPGVGDCKSRSAGLAPSSAPRRRWRLTSWAWLLLALAWVA